jgi:hypothetical protein
VASALDLLMEIECRKPPSGVFEFNVRQSR